MQWNAANILTVGRLVLVPVFYIFFVLGIYWAAFLAFAVAGFTDLIDGTVARLLKQHSKIGALLDPLADKMLMITTFSCLVSVRLLPLWFLVIVILRDVMIMSGIALLRVLKIDVVYEPFLSSKVATLSQIGLGFLALLALWAPSAHIWVYPVSDFAEGLMYISTVLVIVSGLQYSRRGIEILQAHNDKLSKYRS